MVKSKRSPDQDFFFHKIFISHMGFVVDKSLSVLLYTSTAIISIYGAETKLLCEASQVDNRSLSVYNKYICNALEAGGCFWKAFQKERETYFC